MKKSIFNYLLGGAIFLSAPMLTSCDEILSEILGEKVDTPTESSTSTDSDSSSSTSDETYIVYTAAGTSSEVAIPSTATAWNFTSGNVPAGTYYVEGSFTSTGALVFQGEVNLILMDGATLTVDNGIGYTGSGSLNIYAQSEGTSMGHLVVNYGTAVDDEEPVAIKIKDMEIHGGQIEATSYSGTSTTYCNYGIEVFGNLTIYAGNTTATGKKSGYGICISNPATMVLNGGTVTANGGPSGGVGIYSDTDITVNGGTLAAIGGENTGGIGGDGIQGNIVVTNCTMITATGGTGTTNGSGLSTYKTMNISTNLKYSINNGAAVVGTGVAVTPDANTSLVIEPNS